MEYHRKQMTFELDTDVYEPAEDSELLAEVLEQNISPRMSVLDMGSGCGLLGIIAAAAGCDVCAVDINPKAVEIAKCNALLNNVEMKCIVSDLFEKVPDKFDIIVFNPPYLPDKDDVLGSEMWSNNGTIGRFIRQAKEHLNPGGMILLLTSSLTPTSAVVEEFGKIGLDATIMARRKVPWETLSVVCARR
jgi:release factor glutamine methyltransferase